MTLADLVLLMADVAMATNMKLELYIHLILLLPMKKVTYIKTHTCSPVYDADITLTTFFLKLGI